MKTNLTRNDITFLIECINAKEKEAAHEKMQALFLGALGDGNKEDKIEKAKRDLDEIDKRYGNDEGKITIVKAKLFMLRDEINISEIPNDVEKILKG